MTPGISLLSNAQPSNPSYCLVSKQKIVFILYCPVNLFKFLKHQKNIAPFSTFISKSYRECTKIKARKDQHLLSTDRFRCPVRWPPVDPYTRWTMSSCRCCPSLEIEVLTATIGCSWASNIRLRLDLLPFSKLFPARNEIIRSLFQHQKWDYSFYQNQKWDCSLPLVIFRDHQGA